MIGKSVVRCMIEMFHDEAERNITLWTVLSLAARNPAPAWLLHHHPSTSSITLHSPSPALSYGLGLSEHIPGSLT